MIIKYCVVNDVEVFEFDTPEQAESEWHKFYGDKPVYQGGKLGVVIDNVYTRIQDIPDDVWKVLTKEQKLALDKYFD